MTEREAAASLAARLTDAGHVAYFAGGCVRDRLLGLVPQRVEDSWIAQARVDGLLLAGRDGEACVQVPTGLARYPQDLYWAKAQVFCQFAAEQTDQALLGLDLAEVMRAKLEKNRQKYPREEWRGKHE